jgi:NAD+ synthase (glutamine-hydrolysing)
LLEGEEKKTVRIVLCQANPVVGDLAGNRQKAMAFLERARPLKPDLLIFPELYLCGYPPEDLLHRSGFLKQTRQALLDLAGQFNEIPLLIGWAESTDAGVYNSAALLAEGRIVSNYRKACLSDSGIFDETRYFLSGVEPVVITIRDVRWAVTICEDLWDLERLDSLFQKIRSSFDGILNLSASPFYIGKHQKRQDVLSRCALHFGCPLIFCNLVGGQDELVIDGRSMVFGADGRLLFQAAGFEEDLLYVEFEKKTDAKIECKADAGNTSGGGEDEGIAEVWRALVLGTADYVKKNGFTKVLLGLSGGVDSALAVAIAVEALGSQNVVGLSMPSRFNSQQTQADARQIAENLEIEFHTLAIDKVLESFSGLLGSVKGWSEKGVAYENLQARIRGMLLMSLSNQFGYLVLTCGNKSETAVGYSTLYGDTAGGLAALKDIPKTMVYPLCDYYNRIRGRKVIPQSVIDRIPSAELRDNQKDSDWLPEYDLLDQILKEFIEEKWNREELISQGFPSDAVEKVCRLIYQNEYKRRQNPPGIKITPCAFGKDLRMPITHRYRG